MTNPRTWGAGTGTAAGKPRLTLDEALARRARVLELLAAGWSLRRVGAELGISAPRVAAIRDHEPRRDPVTGKWLRPPRSSKGAPE